MAQERFTIVFEELARATASESTSQGGITIHPAQDVDEMREIAELRRIVASVTDPEPIFYSGT